MRLKKISPFLTNFTMYKKKTVFISASSSGIGFYLAQKYKSLGYNVIINGTNKLKLKKASALLECDYFIGDLTNLKSIYLLTKKIKRKYNYIDLLICNLGSTILKKTIKIINMHLSIIFTQQPIWLKILRIF